MREDLKHAARHDECPVDSLLNKISGPWTTYILWLLRQNEVLRFGELRAHMPGISPKVLTERLRRLEADGLVSRDQRPTIPPQVFYRLTPRGEELKDILDQLGAVAQRWAAEDFARAQTGVVIAQAHIQS
jgi:DNA-binding HxlR family transcriptional regulator